MRFRRSRGGLDCDTSIGTEISKSQWAIAGPLGQRLGLDTTVVARGPPHATCIRPRIRRDEGTSSTLDLAARRSDGRSAQAQRCPAAEPRKRKDDMWVASTGGLGTTERILAPGILHPWSGPCHIGGAHCERAAHPAALASRLGVSRRRQPGAQTTTLPVHKPPVGRHNRGSSCSVLAGS